MIAWLATAWADDPAPTPAPAAPDPPPAAPDPPPAPDPAPAGPEPEPEVVVIYAEERVRQARERVETLLQDMGYGAVEVVDEGDHVVYRHVEPWKGEVVLWDDGWMQVRRQPFRVEGHRMPWAETDSALAWAGCLVWPWLCVHLGGGTVGHRKWLGVETATVGVVHGPVEEWGDRIADLATDRTVDGLPPRLDALWQDGVPLEGEGTLETPSARRDAIRAYYLSRTDTVWGEAVRDAIRGFVYAVVQTSDTPFPAEEVGVFVPGAAR